MSDEIENVSAGGEGPSAGQPTRRAVKRPVGYYVAVAVAVVAVIVACFFAFKSCSDEGSRERDPNANMGQLDGKTDEEIQAELNRIVEEGMFNISISGEVEFASGTSEGELRIENVPGNQYLMQVTIVRDDNGRTVYESGIIEPNWHIQKARLSEDLPAGTYPCTATFYAYDAETEELVGQAAAKVSIVVLS